MPAEIVGSYCDYGKEQKHELQFPPADKILRRNSQKEARMKTRPKIRSGANVHTALCKAYSCEEQPRSRLAILAWCRIWVLVALSAVALIVLFTKRE